MEQLYKWTDEKIKAMIYSKLPIPEQYFGNLEECLDEFKKQDVEPVESNVPTLLEVENHSTENKFINQSNVPAVKKAFVNIYGDANGRFLGDEYYESYKTAFENRDDLSTYIETVEIKRSNVPAVNYFQEVCKEHEFTDVEYSDTTGKNEITRQCKKCGLFIKSNVPVEQDKTMSTQTNTLK